MVTLFRLADQIGQFEDEHEPITSIQRIIITGVPRAEDFPANSDMSRDTA
jgi:hypothetical protein